MKKILNSQTIYPNAKLNIYLEIIGQKKNGYHLLETVMVPISLCDEINITIYDKGDISVKTLNLEIAQEENIVYKILKKAKEKFNLKFGAEIIVNKKIPSGAGLGGGSSDAAFVLKFLNEVLKFANISELIKFSSLIGADIPFFLINKPSFCEGIGEIITPIDIPKESFYLFTPNYHVNTAKIFQQRANFLDKKNLFGKSIKNSLLKDTDIYSYLKENNKLFFNRLTESVRLIEPNLFDIVNEKFENKLNLTGTGSCFYTNTKTNGLVKVKIL